MVANIGTWPEADSRTAQFGRTISGIKTAIDESGRARARLAFDENVAGSVNANMIVGTDLPSATSGRGGALRGFPTDQQECLNPDTCVRSCLIYEWSRSRHTTLAPSPFEKPPLGGIAGERRCGGKLLERRVEFAAPEFELPHGGGRERVLAQAIGVSNRTQRLEAGTRAISLANGNRAVEGDHRRGRNVHQTIVEMTDVPQRARSVS